MFSRHAWPMVLAPAAAGCCSAASRVVAAAAKRPARSRTLARWKRVKSKVCLHFEEMDW